MKSLRFSFRHKFTTPLLITSSFVIALASPIASVNAQAATQTILDQLKQKVTSAIDTNLAKLQQTQDSLSLSITADKNGVSVDATGPNGTTVSGSASKDGASGSVSSSNGSASGTVNSSGASGTASSSSGSSASGSVSGSGASASANGSKGGSASLSIGGGNGLTGSLSVPTDLKTKLQQANQKAIDKLKELKAQVEASSQLADVQATAKAYDQQFQDFAIANVQASVTKAIDSMTKVLDRLQLVANKIQTQVDKIKQCIQGVKDSTASANATVGSGSASASVNASAPGCNDLNVDVNSGDAAASLQAKVDEVKSTMQTIRTFLSGSIELVTQLKSGNYSGTMTSFKGISSQIDIVAELSASVQNDLLNLSASVSK